MKICAIVPESHCGPWSMGGKVDAESRSRDAMTVVAGEVLDWKLTVQLTRYGRDTRCVHGPDLALLPRKLPPLLHQLHLSKCILY